MKIIPVASNRVLIQPNVDKPILDIFDNGNIKQGITIYVKNRNVASTESTDYDYQIKITADGKLVVQQRKKRAGTDAVFEFDTKEFE
jgi:hypothetical protein